MSAGPDTPVAVVQAWLAAANAGAVERLLMLSDAEIELVGPRGSGRGHQILYDWPARAGATFETRRIFARESRVVVAQHGTWRSPVGGQVVGTAEVASVFDVVEGRVVRFARYDDLADALAAAGLSERDAVPWDC